MSNSSTLELELRPYQALAIQSLRTGREKPVIDRVLERVEMIPESGCWIFMGALHESGYGIVGLGGRGDGVDRTHRVAYRHFHGEIPAGLFVCHSCDVRACCNPNHLFLGTAKDNTTDMLSKSRGSKPPRNFHDKGENRYNAKLTEADVIAMRRRHEDGTSIYRIAKDYGLCQAVASRIVKRKSWRHVA